MPPFEGTIDRAMHAAIPHASARLEYAGPEVQDPNRAQGTLTTSREYRFGAMTLDQLKKLVGALLKEAPGLTVMELRWALDPKAQGGMLRKPVLRVGWRGAL